MLFAGAIATAPFCDSPEGLGAATDAGWSGSKFR
jgi:hypothetical protein